MASKMRRAVGLSPESCAAWARSRCVRGSLGSDFRRLHGVARRHAAVAGADGDHAGGQARRDRDAGGAGSGSG